MCTAFPMVGLPFLLVLGLASPPASIQDGGGLGWLDRPLAGWNTPGAPLTPAPPADEHRGSLLRRYGFPLAGATAAARAIADAGWVPFPPFDRRLVEQDVEIVGGMRDADQSCTPSRFTLFVFVGGVFAGTLSPELMNSGRDGVAHAVRLAGPESITVEFARYRDGDTACCPSSRVTVTFRVDRSAAQPVVVPSRRRVTRG